MATKKKDDAEENGIGDEVATEPEAPKKVKKEAKKDNADGTAPQEPNYTIV
jgi:hypothetical protein